MKKALRSEGKIIKDRSYSNSSKKIDKDIELNVIGIPKTQVKVKKTAQKYVDDEFNMYKISIDTEKRRKGSKHHVGPLPQSLSKRGPKRRRRGRHEPDTTTSESDSGDMHVESSTTGGGPKSKQRSGVCLTLGEKNKDVRIVSNAEQPSKKKSAVRKDKDKTKSVGFSAEDAVYGTDSGESTLESDSGVAGRAVPYQRMQQVPVFNVNERPQTVFTNQRSVDHEQSISEVPIARGSKRLDNVAEPSVTGSLPLEHVSRVPALYDPGRRNVSSASVRTITSSISPLLADKRDVTVDPKTSSNSESESGFKGSKPTARNIDQRSLMPQIYLADNVGILQDEVSPRQQIRDSGIGTVTHGTPLREKESNYSRYFIMTPSAKSLSKSVPSPVQPSTRDLMNMTNVHPDSGGLHPEIDSNKTLPPVTEYSSSHSADTKSSSGATRHEPPVQYLTLHPVEVRGPVRESQPHFTPTIDNVPFQIYDENYNSLKTGPPSQVTNMIHPQISTTKNDLKDESTPSTNQFSTSQPIDKGTDTVDLIQEKDNTPYTRNFERKNVQEIKSTEKTISEKPVRVEKEIMTEQVQEPNNASLSKPGSKSNKHLFYMQKKPSKDSSRRTARQGKSLTTSIPKPIKANLSPASNNDLRPLQSPRPRKYDTYKEKLPETDSIKISQYSYPPLSSTHESSVEIADNNYEDAVSLDNQSEGLQVRTTHITKTPVEDTMQKQRVEEQKKSPSYYEKLGKFLDKLGTKSDTKNVIRPPLKKDKSSRKRPSDFETIEEERNTEDSNNVPDISEDMSNAVQVNDYYQDLDEPTIKNKQYYDDQTMLAYSGHVGSQTPFARTRVSAESVGKDSGDVSKMGNDVPYRNVVLADQQLLDANGGYFPGRDVVSDELKNQTQLRDDQKKSPSYNSKVDKSLDNYKPADESTTSLGKLLLKKKSSRKTPSDFETIEEENIPDETKQVLDTDNTVLDTDNTVLENDNYKDTGNTFDKENPYYDDQATLTYAGKVDSVTPFTGNPLPGESDEDNGSVARMDSDISYLEKLTDKPAQRSVHFPGYGDDNGALKTQTRVVRSDIYDSRPRNREIRASDLGYGEESLPVFVNDRSMVNSSTAVSDLIVFPGSAPNTAYNVFYTGTTPTSRSPSKTEKIAAQGVRGLLIFVNKKKHGDKDLFDDGDDYNEGRRKHDHDEGRGKHDHDEGRGKHYGQGDKSKRPPHDSDRFKHRRSSDGQSYSSKRDPYKNMTFERSPSGRKLTQRYPCGCYRVFNLDSDQELVNEELVATHCKDGSQCEVGHLEPLTHDRIIPLTASGHSLLSGWSTWSRARGHHLLPAIEIVADGILSSRPIPPKPPAKTMKGADFTAALNVKSDKVNGVFNFYLDPRLKKYLRNNLDNIRVFLENDKDLSKGRT